MAPNNEDAIFLQRMKDPRLRPLWRLTHTLIKVRNGALTHKDVKNEDRPDYVYENKGAGDKMDDNRADFVTEIDRLRGNSGRNKRCADLFCRCAALGHGQ